MNGAAVHVGDCRAVLATLPERSVQTCVTSPPYFNLRDYGIAGQIGLEGTVEEYVQALVEVFRGVWRVLRDDGTCWVNLGDSYNAYNGNAKQGGPVGLTQSAQRPKLPAGYGLTAKTLKSKDLIGIPWRVAFALQADGWWLRSDIIWSKPNCMPESVTDRPTRSHEYLFLLSKSERYYYDAEAIKEPVTGNTHSRGTKKSPPQSLQHEESGAKVKNNRSFMEAVWDAVTSRNKRTVWTVPSQPYSGAHFATFPEKLIEPCILAGSSPQACMDCGAPYARVVERTPMVVPERQHQPRVGLEGTSLAFRDDGAVTGERRKAMNGQEWAKTARSETVGWSPTCAHDAPGGKSVVLDPFAGSGTTLRVAIKHGRAAIGIELNPNYAERQIEARTDGVQLSMESWL